MLISCPACSAKMKIKAEKYEGKRLSLKCVRCKEPFKTERIQLKKVIKRKILVAHSDLELCKAVSEILEEENFDYSVCSDGFEALDLMDKHLPDVLLVDVALPGLYAFEVVEKVRKRPGLEKVKIILLSSVFNKAAYKRRPTTLYGADDYLEKHHVVDQITDKVNLLFGDKKLPTKVEEKVVTKKVDGNGTTPGKADDGWDYIQEVNDRIQRAEEKEITAATDDVVVEKSKRLARIIVSDIALYHQDRVESGIKNGNFYEVMADEYKEGEKLFEERVPQEIRNQQDYLKQAFDAFISRRQQES